MQYEYGVAPITYTNGIPTYKGGEWEGKLSCKFHSYKRVIRPKDHGIIYNQYINFQTEPRKLMKEKKHYFPYKKQIENDYFEKMKNLPNSKIIRNETKLLMEENGYHKKNYFTFYNKDLKNIDFSRDHFGKLTWIENEPYQTLREKKNESFRDCVSQGNNGRNLSRNQRINSWDVNIQNFHKANLTLHNLNKNSTQTVTN